MHLKTRSSKEALAVTGPADGVDAILTNSSLVERSGGKMIAIRWRVVAAVVAVLLAAAAGVVGLQTSANAAARVGGVDVERVCQWDYGYHAYVAYWSAFGWRCNPVPNNAYYKILDKNADMNKACRLQYGQYAWASYFDSGNPYSWSCYR